MFLFLTSSPVNHTVLLHIFHWNDQRFSIIHYYTCVALHVLVLFVQFGCPVNCRNSRIFCLCNHLKSLCMECAMSNISRTLFRENCTVGEQVRQAALFIGSRTSLYLTWRRALPSVNTQYALKPCPLFTNRLWMVCVLYMQSNCVRTKGSSFLSHIHKYN